MGEQRRLSREADSCCVEGAGGLPHSSDSAHVYLNEQHEDEHAWSTSLVSSVCDWQPRSFHPWTYSSKDLFSSSESA